RGIWTGLHVAAEGPLVDEEGSAGRRPLVVHVEGSPTVREGPVVDDGDQVRSDPVAEAPAEGGDALSVEVALEPVTDRLVKEDSWPAGAENHRHRPGRGIDRAEIHDGLPGRRSREPGPPVVLEEEVEPHAAPPAVTPELPSPV